MNIYQDSHKALALLRDDPTRFAGQGSVVATWRTYRGRRLGPYYRLAWRENGRQCSIYLGRQGPLVDEVRHLLHEAQAIRRMVREHRHRQALFKEHVIRPLQQYVKEMFRLFGNGLYVKGSDIGGIRTAGPRLTTADVPEHLIPKFPLPLPSFLTELHSQTDPHTNPNREREEKPPSAHTNPKRERGQGTPSPDTASKCQREQRTTSSSTAPNHERQQKTHPPHQHRHQNEFHKSVDQNPPHFPVINLSVIHHPPSPYRHENEFPRSVDQKRLHTTRGPPNHQNRRVRLDAPTAARR